MKWIKFLALALITCSSVNAQRIYISDEDLECSHDRFRIHRGNNMWIETETIHRDETGLYTLENSIILDQGKQGEYQQRWKCPYCYQYWPIGKACQNKDCPSKYKGLLKGD